MVANKGMQDLAKSKKRGWCQFLIPALKMWALTLAQAQCSFFSLLKMQCLQCTSVDFLLSYISDKINGDLCCYLTI